MTLPIKPPFTVCARGDALAAPLYDAPGPAAVTLHDRYGDPCGVIVRGGPSDGPIWLLSAPGDAYWNRWKAETNVWDELPMGQPGRLRLITAGSPARVVEGAQAIEFYGITGHLDALAHRVLSDDTWAFTSCVDDDWESALVRFGYIGDV